MTEAAAASGRGGRLTGKVCVVTGAGSGIGLATVERFLLEGALVAGFDLDATAAADAGAHAAMTVDVTDEGSMAEAMDRTVADLGSLDVLVANAGIAHEAKVENTELSDWDRVLRVNLTGVFLSAKHAIRRMPKGGSLVFHASMSGLVATAEEPASCASKAGVIALARSIAVDNAAQGIRANCVSPGVVDTPMTIAQFQPVPGFRDMVERAHPAGRFALPSEIAAASAFLACDESAFITGANLVIDGGYTAR
jgi:NAD(P)-dependent dehydrogenase (short-subunit alcohol dehydrogenase family)